MPESDIEKKSKTAEEIISHVVKSLKSDEFYNKLGQEIFDATFAYNALYHRLMIPHEEIAALLALEPITQWVKLKDRIVTQKESKAHHA